MKIVFFSPETMTSGDESDSESVTADKQNTRTSWIYGLKTEDLADQLGKFVLPVPRTAAERRKALSQFIKGEYKKPSEAGTSSNPIIQNSSTNPNPPDVAGVCNAVRKWNLIFDGSKDVIAFLERLDELKTAYQLDGEQMLHALPEMLKGPALLWYRNSRDSWNSWNEFLSSFELQFLPNRYRETLDLEIRGRTQGTNELFRDFVVALQTLMRRHGRYTEEQQFQRIYEDTLPE